MQYPNVKMLRIPVKATYQIIDGKAVKVSAEYADISADEFARFLLRGFGLCPDDLLNPPANEG